MEENYKWLRENDGEALSHRAICQIFQLERLYALHDSLCQVTYTASPQCGQTSQSLAALLADHTDTQRPCMAMLGQSRHVTLDLSRPDTALQTWSLFSAHGPASRRITILLFCTRQTLCQSPKEQLPPLHFRGYAFPWNSSPSSAKRKITSHICLSQKADGLPRGEGSRVSANNFEKFILGNFREICCVM